MNIDIGPFSLIGGIFFGIVLFLKGLFFYVSAHGDLSCSKGCFFGILGIIYGVIIGTIIGASLKFLSLPFAILLILLVIGITIYLFIKHLM